jgi:lipopolysaccharide export system protein LptA
MQAVGHIKNNYLIFIFFFLATLLVSPQLFTQTKTKINLIDADELLGRTVDGVELNIFIGNVAFEHDSAFMYCDSAVIISGQNRMKAYRNVHIWLSDTLSLYSDELDYNGNTRIATVIGNVRLIDNDATLTTDRLIYERNTELAYYTTGGKIVNEDNVLTSQKGYYYTETKDLYFKENVVFDNPEYHLVSDTLKYNTDTELADILGPTTITGEDELLYAEGGWYDAKSDISKLRQNPYLLYKEQYMSGDSIFYDKEAGIGQAFSNVFIKDSVQNMIITGNFADYRRQDGYAFATDSAQAILIDEKDSLYMHSDTLRLIFDSVQSPYALKAFYKTKYYKTDIQGMCDSLVYLFSDSTISMFGKPALWTQDNQLTAEMIKIFSSNQRVDSMQMTSSSFIISQDKFGEERFNQIKGKNMVGYFRNNELYKIDVEGNSETIYYVSEESGALIGINKALASSMSIFIEDRQVADIYYYEKPDAHLTPEELYPVQELKLKNFQWLGDHRPKNKFDIFRWERTVPVLGR